LARIRDLQRRTEELFLSAAGSEAVAKPRAGLRFSPFVPEHVEGALELVDRWIALTESRRGNAGLEAALADVESELLGDDPELAKHALMIFITHHPKASQLPIPSLEERRPDLAAKAAESGAEGLEAVEGESQLDWFREDPLANQHHEHWHVVYPVRGIPDGQGGRAGKDRQGELFFYMHQQMLARYDTERLAAGLKPVRSLATYNGAIAEGYDSGLADFRARGPGRRLATVDLGGGPYTVQQHARLRDRIRRAVDSSRFEDGSPVDADALGAAVEPSLRRGGPTGYGNLHGFGHVLIALAEDAGDTARPGVMWTTGTAIMDPVFYRWHRHIDDQLFRWQEKQPPHDLSDAPPAVASPPLLVFSDTVPTGSRSGAQLQAWANRTFGGAKWRNSFDGSPVVTAELETGFRTRPSPAGPLDYLDHRDFLYALRLENSRPQATDVTVRIFLAPEAGQGSRRMWIEMDKFHHRLAARAKTVVARRAALSSVVQKPAARPPRPRRDPTLDPQAAENYCNCGWPFHLLVPRGTAEGMRFRLLVMLTDWSADQVSRESHCGSMSFCGVRDASYPDKRPMGYPFDRPLVAGTTIDDVVTRQSNMAMRDISIRFRARL
jgi:tyrosinase